MLHICKQKSMIKKTAHLSNLRCDLTPFFSTRGPKVRPRRHVLLPWVGGMQQEEWGMWGIPMCSVSPPGPADDTRRIRRLYSEYDRYSPLMPREQQLNVVLTLSGFQGLLGEKSYNFVHIYTGAWLVHKLSCCINTSVPCYKSHI